jgi:ribosomal protein L4
MAWQDVTVYHILKHKVLIMTAAAAEAIAERLQQPLPQHAARPVRAAWWEEHKKSYEQALQQLLSAQQQ